MKKTLFSILVLITSFSSFSQIQVVNDITCFGDTTGALIAVPGFGTAPYTYLWNNGETSQSLHNLGSGTYSVTVTDALMATANYNYDLTEPAQIQITYAAGDITPSTCDGFNNGAANVTITGGIAPYNYLWHEQQSDSLYYTEDISNVRGGNYLMTVVDYWNCEVSQTIVIPNTDTIPYTATVEEYVCNGLTGAVDIRADEAIVGYYFTYSWDTPYETGNYISNDTAFNGSVNLLAGSYTITITDNQTNCDAYFDFTINQSATPMVVEDEVVHNECDFDNFASISLMVTGGDPKPLYNVTWTGPSGFTATDQFVLSGLVSGVYNYVVTDDSVCVTHGTVVVESLSGSCFTLPNMLTPNGDGFNDTYYIEGACNYTEYLLEIYDSWGKLIFTSTDCAAEWDPLGDNAPPNSVYYYLVRLSDGITEREYKNSIDIKY
ncbi:MAG: gliding motility-associated C-terminal domain-containing protein [Bacteroidales bacterium]|nr:gliding motility-associated C-terminal domain-containing protein [Bacteroidales bacterium]